MKKKENKIWKWFRHLTSLGIGGAMLFLFPNFIITQLSFLVGILVGKGIISTALGFTITTFLGSQLGILLQKGLIALLSYLISNISLKLVGKIPNLFKKKNKNIKNIQYENSYQKNNKNLKINNIKKENKQEDIIFEKPIIKQEKKQYVKKLGSHPSLRQK